MAGSLFCSETGVTISYSTMPPKKAIAMPTKLNLIKKFVVATKNRDSCLPPYI